MSGNFKIIAEDKFLRNTNIHENIKTTSRYLQYKNSSPVLNFN